MTYCTQQDLVDRFGTLRLAQLTDRVNKPASVIDAVVIGKHIADASSMIDGYLAKRYSLPLASVPSALTKIGVDLAWYYLLGDGAGKDDPASVAYRDAMRWLENVAKGLIVIESAGEIPSPAGGGQIKTSAPDRVFTRDSLAGL